MNNVNAASEIADVRRFLLTNGFIDTTLSVLNDVAYLVAESTNNAELIMAKAYAELAASAVKPDTVRVKLEKHVKRNYPSVCSQVKKNYGHDIGEYAGVKKFVEIMAILYCEYGQSI